MASSLAPKTQAFQAGADLSTHQYKQVKLSALDTVVICGADERAEGILMNAPVAGEVAEVAVSGGALAKVGTGGATLGASIASGALGVSVNAGAAKFSIGVFQDAGVEGDVVPVIIDRHNTVA